MISERKRSNPRFWGLQAKGWRSFAPAALAALLSLVLLIGRWTPARLQRDALSGSEDYLAGPARLWLLALVLGALLFSARLLPGLSSGWSPRLTDWRRLSYFPAYIVACLSYMVLTAAWAPVWQEGWVKAVDIAVVVASVALVLRVRALDAVTLGKVLHWFWIAVFIGTGLLGIMALLQPTYHLDTGRVASLGGGPNVFGRNMSLLAISSVYVARAHERLAVACGAMFVVGLLLLAQTGSRGAMAGALCAGVAYLIVYRIRLRWLLICVVLVGAVIFLASDLPVVSDAREVFSLRVSQQTFGERYTANRSIIYGDGLGCVKDHFPGGRGLGGFSSYRDGYNVFDYPHNVFLELGCEGGAAGLALGLLTALSLGIVIIDGWRRVAPEVLAGLVLFFVASQFSGDLYDNRGLFLFMALAAISVGARVPAQAKSPRRGPT